MRHIDLIVIHCSATQHGVDVDVRMIDKWHRNRGFAGVGYHYVIRLDGTIERGRDINRAGAHAKGYNSNSIGICYVGGLDSKDKPKDTRTKQQKQALRNIVTTLKSIYGDLDVVGHRDLSADLNGDGVITPGEWMKSCPCYNVKDEIY